MVASAAPNVRPAHEANQRQHVALVGFMGAGKSEVGRLIAARTGLHFVDLDEVICQEAGQTVAEIFRDHGEVGFRARERAAVRRVLAEATPAVIATGGGTFVDPQSREAIIKDARSVFLEAGAEALLGRLDPQQRAGRPLLRGPDPAATLRRMLSERTPAYEQCELTVPTEGLGLEAVADEVIRVLRLLPVNADMVARRQTGRGSARPTGVKPVLQVASSAGVYAVELRQQAGAWIAAGIAGAVTGSRVAVITDATVAPLHAEALVRDLNERGKQTSLHVVPPGEASKSLETAGRLYDELLQVGLGRADAAVALGGGVVGDLCGFVASTILRGVRYFQVPTTTLAAVDSSVGGKTAINTPRGKNLVGTFYPPSGVFVAVAHLATQPRRQHAAGLCEALKMAATLDAELFDDILAHAGELLAFAPQPLLQVVSRALQLKAAVVARDERETGERAVLNYGHTIGHAIEAGEHYRVLHGEAVALGMAAEAQWAVGEGMPREVEQRLVAGLEALGLPTNWAAHAVDLAALELDKKRVESTVRMPIVPAIGSFELRSVPVRAVSEFIRRRKSA